MSNTYKTPGVRGLVHDVLCVRGLEFESIPTFRRRSTITRVALDCLALT